MDPQFKPLLEAASGPYAAAGRYAWHFARGKLRHDPIFIYLLRHGLLPDGGSLLDLGCGQGILLALLDAAKKQHRSGLWPQGWPAPPLHLDMRGVEVREDRVRAARRALGSSAQVDLRDLREFDFRPCSVIVMLDVLHYLGAEDQQRVLEKAARSLDPDGVLLVREADAGAGFLFQVTKWCERIAEAGRGRLRNSLHFRGLDEWVAVLENLGFGVRVESVSGGTPFANVLFVARKKARNGQD
jgi:SAM-dependent methyltransferase